MRKMLAPLILLVSVMTAGAALAAEQTITFAVENMTCTSCPYIVQKSMASVPGVTRVDVSFEAKTATVTFDDAKATADAIAAASTNAGYPTRLAQKGN